MLTMPPISEKRNIPALSVHGNNLQPLDLPNHLQDLNTLEQFLITPVLPFMKIISLPKGLQKGIHGPVVCVPADVNATIQTLPRTIDDSSLLKVKLKRRLQYKGHHLYQQIRMNVVLAAAQFLKEHHPQIKGK